MAWTTILDTVLAVGKPIRAIDIRAIRDNVTAVAQGLTGAPKILNAAFSNNTISLLRLILDSDFAARVGWGVVNQGVFGIGVPTLGTIGGAGANVGTNYAGSAITVSTYGNPPGTYKCIGRFAAGTELFLRIS